MSERRPPWGPGDVGLTDDEYALAVSRLGREPGEVELGMLGALWSEHCAYKHSRPLLRQLPTRSERVLVGPGENAGAVDLGGGLAVVFKVESHNHPSAVEPYQGAATGVGGIVRDVFAMGARPVALLNALFFGDPSLERTRRLYGGVVGGISFYGNCLGIPDVGGHVAFHPSYDGNPLVNAMCVGIVPTERITRASGARAGDAVYLIGADTGRDGIAGASLLASFELGDADQEKRPAVQVGDPFLEKLVMEACLELVEADHVGAMQDLGAAGLACATSEVAAKAKAGIELDVLAVPRRAGGMAPYEVLLSESQERMLVVPKRGHESDLERICARWGVRCARIGRVVAEDVVRVREGEAVAAEISAALLVDGAPTYEREAAPPPAPAVVRATLPATPRERLLALLAAPRVASRERVYRRYDQMVGIDTVIGPGADAAVLRLRGRRDGIALALDAAPPELCARDPLLGAAASVTEAARNLVCVGARPLALTDCLNLGNPERPAGAWQLREVVAGLARAAEALALPFVSGNVSLYNGRVSAGALRDIVPTPVVGAVGRLDDVARSLRPGIGDDGDALVLLGDPGFDLEREARLHALVLDLHARELLGAAHDLGAGGFAVALAEMAIRGARGARARAVGDPFAESTGGRILVATPNPSEVDSLARRSGVRSMAVGRVGGPDVVIDGALTVSVVECARAYRGGLAEALGL